MSQRAILIGIIVGLLLIITSRFQLEVNLSALVVGGVAALSAYLAQDAEHKQEKL
jgi:predicted phage tail protein